MNLQSFLQDKSTTEFEVVRVDMEVAETDGKKIAILHLKDPIPVVEGSRSITDRASNTSERITQYDVDRVRIHEDDFGDEGINLKEDGTGFVKSNLRLDVSNRGDVWLKKQSFASFARDKRNERADSRTSGILTKMNDRKAQATFKGTDVNKQEPAAVATTTGG